MSRLQRVVNEETRKMGLEKLASERKEENMTENELDRLADKVAERIEDKKKLEPQTSEQIKTS